MIRRPRRRAARRCVGSAPARARGLRRAAAAARSPQPVPAVAPPATTIGQSDDVLTDLGAVLAAGDAALDPALLPPARRRSGARDPVGGVRPGHRRRPTRSRRPRSRRRRRC